LLKLLNSLLFSFLASEWVLAKRRVPRYSLLALLVVNGVLSEWGLVGLLSATPGQQARLGAAFIAASLWVSALWLWYRGALRRIDLVDGAHLYLAFASFVAALQLGAAIALLAHGWFQTGKVVGAATVFTVAGYVDARRCLPESKLPLGAYARHLGWSLLLVLPVYPILGSMVAAPVLLFLVDVVEGLGLHTKKTQGALNELIFDSVFYGPFVAVYVLAKRACLQDRTLKEATPLPTRMFKTSKA